VAVKFTWDPKKAVTNFKKHEVTFDEATSAFRDERAIFDRDGDRPDHGRLISAARGLRLPFVVHVQFDLGRTDPTARILGARRATRAERKIYETSARRDNPFCAEIARGGMILAPDPPKVAGTESIPVGRPTREEGRRPSASKSVRLPVALWSAIETKARSEKTTINAAMREAAHLWLRA
jgi:uncharacterized protein